MGSVVTLHLAAPACPVQVQRRTLGRLRRGVTRQLFAVLQPMRLAAALFSPWLFPGIFSGAEPDTSLDGEGGPGLLLLLVRTAGASATAK